MRFSSIIRLASAGLLLCSMSSFSGCEKDNVCPKSGHCCNKTATTTPAPTPTDTTKPSGAN